MDYLKLFQTHEEYETFVSGGTMVRPNVSHCIQENEVHYNALEVDPVLSALQSLLGNGVTSYKIQFFNRDALVLVNEDKCVKTMDEYTTAIGPLGIAYNENYEIEFTLTYGDNGETYYNNEYLVPEQYNMLVGLTIDQNNII